MCVYTRFGAYFSTIGFQKPIGSTVQCAFSPLGRIAIDGVYSTDVMEHIPKEQLPETFNNIFSRAEKFVFLAICTKPAIAVLPSGENAHCTVEPIGFWVTMVEKYSPKRVYTHIKTYGNCNNYSILNEELYLEWYLNQF